MLRRTPRRRSRRPHLSVVAPPRTPAAGETMEPDEVDRILDKISALGIAGLTTHERAALEQASKVLEERQDEDA